MQGNLFIFIEQEISKLYVNANENNVNANVNLFNERLTIKQKVIIN